MITIVSSQSLDFSNARKILSEMKKEPLYSECHKEIQKLEEKIILFFQNSSRTFMFKEGPLLESMRKGYWVHLEGVEQKPEEAERLMSLFEEIPRLTILEGTKPMIFYTKDYGPKEEERNESIEFIEIHENFRIFLSFSRRRNKKITFIICIVYNIMTNFVDALSP